MWSGHLEKFSSVFLFGLQKESKGLAAAYWEVLLSWSYTYKLPYLPVWLTNFSLFWCVTTLFRVIFKEPAVKFAMSSSSLIQHVILKLIHACIIHVLLVMYTEVYFERFFKSWSIALHSSASIPILSVSSSILYLLSSSSKTLFLS